MRTESFGMDETDLGGKNETPKKGRKRKTLKKQKTRRKPKKRKH